MEEAKLGEWFEVFRRCNEGSDPNETDNHGVSLLHLAAKAGKRRVVELLLTRGAKVLTADAVHGRTVRPATATRFHALLAGSHRAAFRRGRPCTAPRWLAR